MSLLAQPRTLEQALTDQLEKMNANFNPRLADDAQSAYYNVLSDNVRRLSSEIHIREMQNVIAFYAERR